MKAKKVFLSILLIAFANCFLPAQNITVKGTQFFVDCNRIWLNGANTPWNSWNDFGGSFNRNWWNTQFQTLKSKGMNCTRVWISCNGAGAVLTNSAGVTGVSSTFWKDCDSLFAIAKRNGIYIDATMISFDHFQNTNANYQNWRDIVTKQTNSQTFIDNYLIPFVNRYKVNPYLFAIDFCNEPEWISENASGGNLPVNNLQRFFAMCAAAVHNNSTVPVTVGSACIKWNSDNPGCVGNYWKNSALQAAYNDPKAYLDFYCIHYYSWMHQYFQSPFEKSPTDYGINDRPVIIEESPGNDAGLTDIPVTTVQSFESALAKGYQGNLPWTSNGVDSNGDITTIGPATLSFKNNHAALVYPPACTTSISEIVADEQFIIYPNPVNELSVISYRLSENSVVKISLYDMLGREVIKIMEEKQTPGLHLQNMNTEGLQSGIYFIKATIGEREMIEKLIVNKN